MKMFKRTCVVLSILLLNSALYGKGIEWQFTKAASDGHLTEWVVEKNGKKYTYLGINEIISNPEKLNKLLTPKPVVDVIGKALRRAAKNGHVEVVSAILGNEKLHMILAENQEPKNWFEKAAQATENKTIKDMLKEAKMKPFIEKLN